MGKNKIEFWGHEPWIDCWLPMKNGLAFGGAVCSAEDKFDEEFGKELALARARIDKLQRQRKELMRDIAAVKKVYNAVAQCKEFDPRSLEARQFRKQIYILEDRVAAIDSGICTYQKCVDNLVKTKE